MVKKTSFLEKLKNRWRPASGIRLDDRGVSSPTSGSESAPRNVAKPMPEPVSSRKLSTKQEAVVAINEGFKELASLLRGMQTRVDDQGEQIHAAVESLAQLPALSQAQIDLMRTMVERMDKQNSVTEELAAHLADMPELAEKLRASVDRAEATDQRTARTLDEFRNNMASIQSAMTEIVDHSGKHVEATASLASDQQQTLADLATTSEKSAQTLRQAQREQSERIGKLAEANRRTNKAVVWLLATITLALVVIAVMLAV
ncbi:MAG: hypothetical protein KDB80_00375 [Planctomycetes bacterium]|nr:hypothetical protein [Planctomycetota bacterium]